VKHEIRRLWREAVQLARLPGLLWRQHVDERRRDAALTLLFYSRGESEVALNSLINHALGRRATPASVIAMAKEMVGQGEPDWSVRGDDA